MNKELFIQIKSLCTHRCIFCSRDHAKGSDSDLADIILMLKKYDPYDYDRVLIGCDEPLNYPQIKVLLLHLKKRGFRNVLIQTTGCKLNDLDFLKKLKERGVVEFWIPLYGSKADIHDRITRSEGSFDEVLSGLENLVSLKAAFSLHTVVLKQNVSDLLDLQKMCLKKFRKKIRFYLLHPDSKGADEYKQCSPKFSSIPLEVKQDIFSPIPFCIYNKGDIFSCENQTRLEPLPDNLWYRKKYKLKTCCRCAQYLTCEGYYQQYFDLHGEDEFQPMLK